MKLKSLILLAVGAMFLFSIMAVALFLFLKFVPAGARTVHDDAQISDPLFVMDHEFIAVSRPQYIIPREINYTGGFAPFRFWSYDRDPNFETNTITSHHFFGVNNLSRLSDVQGIHINKEFENEELRETLMAIRVGINIYEYPTPGFQYSGGHADLSRFYYIGQDGAELYYYYPYAREDTDFTQANWRNVEAVVRISLPLESGTPDIVFSDDAQWDEMVFFLQTLEGVGSTFSDLCNDRRPEGREFAQLVYSESCP